MEDRLVGVTATVGKSPHEKGESNQVRGAPRHGGMHHVTAQNQFRFGFLLFIIIVDAALAGRSR